MADGHRLGPIAHGDALEGRVASGVDAAEHQVPVRPRVLEEERDEARRVLVPHSELYEKDIWVGSIAELNANKNIELALRAVAKAREAGCPILYVLVGDGDLERLLVQ